MILLSSSVCLLICLSVCCPSVCLHVQLIKQQAKYCFPLLYIFVHTPDLWRSILWSLNSVGFSLDKCNLNWKIKWFRWFPFNATFWIISYFNQSICCFSACHMTSETTGAGIHLVLTKWALTCPTDTGHLFIFSQRQLCVSASVKLQYWPPEVKSHGSIYLYCWQLLQISLSYISCRGPQS